MEFAPHTKSIAIGEYIPCFWINATFPIIGFLIIEWYIFLCNFTEVVLTV